jgi:hypothetical protein
LTILPSDALSFLHFPAFAWSKACSTDCNQAPRLAGEHLGRTSTIAKLLSRWAGEFEAAINSARPGSAQCAALIAPYGKSRLPLLIDGLNGSSIFRLTRVTRIFQKKIFTETTSGARAACRAGFFVARAARAAARGGFLVFAEKTGKYRGSRN